MDISLYSSFKSNLLKFVSFVFLLLSFFWIWMHVSTSIDGTVYFQNWAALYQIIALLGGLGGLYASKNWGGYKSLMGRAVIAFSFGLLLQSFGQSAYSYYINYLKIEVPYPSVGDIGYFGSVLAYMYGAVLLARASGSKFSLKASHNKFFLVFIPFILLTGVYFLFLKDYNFDSSNIIKTFLDFGYPFGQALYVSIAVLALVFSANMLGGVMKKPIRFLIIALIFQYISDFTFLYQAGQGTWYAGGLNDMLYLVSYFLMTVGLVYLCLIPQQMREANS